jgi:hypothetical protein
MASDYRLEFEFMTWVASHPYTELFLFFAFIAGMYMIFIPRVLRKINEGSQGKQPLPKIVILFYIMTAFAIVELIISFIHG